ncbi:MAG: hypothetical protein ACSHYB_09590 [Roseibacillus sp.]
MTKNLLIAGFTALTIGAANAQTNIIGDDPGTGAALTETAGTTGIGNGDFQALVSGTAATFDNSVDWFNASGDETATFTSTSLLGGARPPNGTRGAITSRDVKQVNSTGYTVTAVGEIFSLTYDFGAGGNSSNWDASTIHRTFLFTSTAAVDGAFDWATQGTLVTENLFEANRTSPVHGQWWTPVVFDGFYVTTAADVGNTLYFGMEFVDADNANNGGSGRVDLIHLSVAAPISAPTLTVVTQPADIVLLNSETSGTSDFTIRNDSAASTLTVNSYSGLTGGFSVTSPAVPFSVAPGATQVITVQWDSAVAAPEVSETSTLTLNSNDTANPAVDVSVSGSFESLMNVIVQPADIVVASPDTTGTSIFEIENNSDTTTLTLSSIGITGGTGFSITFPTIPFDLLPGETQEIDVTWDSAAAGAGAVESATLTLNSNDKLVPATELLVNAQIENVISILSEPEAIPVVSPATTGTRDFTIHNQSDSSTLTVNSFSGLTGTGFSVTPTAPFNVAAGADQIITVEWDSASAATTNLESAVLTINSSDAASPAVDVPVDAGFADFYSSALSNGDFETAGTDLAPTWTDAFADWVEVTNGFGDPMDVQAGGPLVTGVGTTSAYLLGVVKGVTARGSIIENDVVSSLSNFEIAADFAISGTGNFNRRLNVIISSLGGGENVNIRYQNGIFQVRDLSPSGWSTIIEQSEIFGGAGLESSVDDDEDGSLDGVNDLKVIYKLKLTGSGWGTSNPYMVLDILDDTGTLIASSGQFKHWFQDNAPAEIDDKLDRVQLSAAFSSAPSSWYDNVVVSGFEINPPVAPAGDIEITACSFDPVTGAGSITFTSVDAVNYEVRASSDLEADLFSSNLVTSGPGTGTSTTLTFTDVPPNGQTQRFYRVEQP